MKNIVLFIAKKKNDGWKKQISESQHVLIGALLDMWACVAFL